MTTDRTVPSGVEADVPDSETQLRLVLDLAAVYLARCDSQQRYRFVNQGYAGRFGLRPEDFIGKTLAEALGQQAYESFRPQVEAVLAGQRVDFEVEVPYERLGRRFMRCTYQPERDASGALVGWMAVLLDVSELAALKESNQRKDEFLAILAHELRNPLAPVKNAVQILRAKGPPLPELQWASEVIDRQVQQMTRLVDDLLDVSRISRGKIELRKERVELAGVLNTAVEASRPLIEKWGHQLAVALPPEPVYLEADRTRLCQVVLNLLNNAAKYTEQAGRIGLTAEREGEWVLIRVKDTGIGIPPEMLSRIFEMFTQADRSLERSQGGLGIGLTLVQRLVEMHGGRVTAHSAGPGQGSEFTVRLPVAPDTTGVAATSSEEEKAAAARRRILVVDDNRDAADSLAVLLRLLGNEVHTAYDGLEAVGASAAFVPDLVLLDIGLPKLNGYDAARRIREQYAGRGMVLVALTGWGQEEDRRRSKEAGFDHYMTKPVEIASLQQLLAELEAAKR